MRGNITMHNRRASSDFWLLASGSCFHNRRLSHIARYLLAALLLTPGFWLLPSAFCQTATATLSGTVEDQNGAVVPSTAVTILNVATAAERQATTNDQGYFTVRLLPPGS